MNNSILLYMNYSIVQNIILLVIGLNLFTSCVDDSHIDSGITNVIVYDSFEKQDSLTTYFLSHLDNENAWGSYSHSLKLASSINDTLQAAANLVRIYLARDEFKFF